MMILSLLTIMVFWLAYANGANDNFKGVATLFGTGTTDYRKAIAFATIATFLGSLTSIFIGKELVSKFSGNGLVSNAILADPRFMIAVCFGTAATVFSSTYLGLPVSTTHALLGSLVGAGLIMSGGAIRLSGLTKGFVLPLLASPLLAIAATLVLYVIFRNIRLVLGITRESCVCIGEEVLVVATESNQAALTTAISGSAGESPKCFERYSGNVIGLEAQAVLDKSHYLSAGAVSFARGINDTPKIVALLLMANLFSIPTGIALVGIAIAVGGIFGAKRVAETMSHKITDMNRGQGFTANLVTALLVLLASGWGMPVSTTHISCGSLFGVGVINGRVNWMSVVCIISAWFITLPLAALCAAMVGLIVR